MAEAEASADLALVPLPPVPDVAGGRGRKRPTRIVGGCARVLVVLGFEFTSPDLVT